MNILTIQLHFEPQITHLYKKVICNRTIQSHLNKDGIPFESGTPENFSLRDMLVNYYV